MTVNLENLYTCMMNRLDHLRQERGEYAEILTFYAKVLLAQQEAQAKTSIPGVDLPEDRFKLKVEEGFALIERENCPIDLDCAEGLFEKLCHVSLGENLTLAAAGKNLLEALDSGKLDFAQLTTAILNNDTEAFEQVANNLEVPFPILHALIKLSLQPSLLAMAAAVTARGGLDYWRNGYCPICGALPAMAALVGEEGKRKALCSFCGQLWLIPRLSCPFCNNTKKEDLRYFYGEGEDLYRVHVCEQCRGYLKVIDTREGGDPRALAVDDVATAHLDLLAENEGYQRKAPRLWGI